jgi:circadian clock protein KaiC
LNVPEHNSSGGVTLLPTGIPGFDLITMGGLPHNRSTLVSGTAGSGKTVFATQFLVEGIRQAGHNAVFVTLEESPDDIRANMVSLGWDIAGWEAEGKWVFVDGSDSSNQEEGTMIGDFDLGGLLARIQAAVNKVGAKRLVMDAISTIFPRFGNQARIRSELLRINLAIKKMGVTSILTGERTSDYGEIGRYGFEEFVADNVIIMRNVLDSELRRRTLEILKFRGVQHRRGEFPFVLINGRGIEIVPLSAVPLEHESSSLRVRFGNDGIDAMLHGGPFRDSITLISGPSGSGKTLLAVEFASAKRLEGERCVFLDFEESRAQLFKHAASWGHDLEHLEAKGLLRVICEYPESANLEDRLIRLKDLIAEFHPTRLVIDSLTALGRLASDKTFRDFIIGLTSFVKQAQITTVLTADSGVFKGTIAMTEKNVSTLTDAIIQLRHVEVGCQMHRGVAVIKMRGSSHDTKIRSFTIDGKGLHVGDAFGEKGPVPQ